jgi:hypothetical protein
MSEKQMSVHKLESIPNVGQAIALKLRLLGFETPADLKGADPYDMYEKLCKLTSRYQDPCLLNVFISAVSFCNGNPPKPWWEFTAKRKKELNKIKKR